MANRLHHIRRAGCAAGAIFLAAAGCAFPHGSTGGDPLLGNFHRPIVPTPPPERGGIGLDSPAYDGGARIGVAVPEAPARTESSTDLQSLPGLTSPNLLSGARLPFQAGDDSTFAHRPRTGFGAKLPSAEPMPRPAIAPHGYVPRSPDGVMPRPRDSVSGLMSAAALAPADLPDLPPLPELRQIGHRVPRDPGRLYSVEDAREALQLAGATHQRSEQLTSGEWLYSCTAGNRVYEARGRDPLDAMRKVLVQVQK